MIAAAAQQHSPGPWAPHLGKCSCRMIWDASGDVIVAVVHGQHWSSSEAIGDPWPTDTVADANLRLISAAPEQHEATLLWREYWLHDRDCAECIRAKRLGQACMEQVERFERAWTTNEAAIAKAEGVEP